MLIGPSPVQTGVDAVVAEGHLRLGFIVGKDTRPEQLVFGDDLVTGHFLRLVNADVKPVFGTVCLKRFVYVLGNEGTPTQFLFDGQLASLPRHRPRTLPWFETGFKGSVGFGNSESVSV